MLMRLAVEWRRMGSRTMRTDSVVKNLFLKKIKEYEGKMAAAAKGGELSLVDATPETQRQLEDQLQRLASKYQLDNKDIVNELPVKGLETPTVESAVLAMLEGKSLEDLKKALKEETEQYTEMRRKKKVEEEAQSAQFQSTTLPTQNPKK